MANLGQTFNKENLPESSGFDPIPAGWYQASVSGAELKDTKDGEGQYIAVQYAILAPTHQGRVVFANINIRNKSAKAQEIGLSNLNALMRSIGLTSISDSDQLVGGSCQIKVKIKAPVLDKETKEVIYEASNDVSGWKAIEGGVPKTDVPKKPAWAK